jgi:hypothetical protein
MDTGQKLTLTHAPDLFRAPEFLGGAVIFLIIMMTARGKINWRAPEILFATSFALMPFAVFNQQVITDDHYSLFTTRLLLRTTSRWSGLSLSSSQFAALLILQA